MTANLADRVEGLPARIYAHEFTGETGRGGWTGHNGYGIGTEFIRADLVDDAVKALEEAREMVEHWADVASRADRTRYDTSDDIAKIDAALTRIKETT